MEVMTLLVGPLCQLGKDLRKRPTGFAISRQDNPVAALRAVGNEIDAVVSRRWIVERIEEAARIVKGPELKAVYHVRFSPTCPPDPVFEPQIQRVVQVDVGQYRRDDPSLRCPGDGVKDSSVLLKHPCSQPLGNQAYERLVVYSFFEHYQHPVV